MVYLGGGSLKISTNMGIELACRGRVMFTRDASLSHFCCGNLRQETELPRPRRSPLSMYMMIMVLRWRKMAISILPKVRAWSVLAAALPITVGPAAADHAHPRSSLERTPSPSSRQECYGVRRPSPQPWTREPLSVWPKTLTSFNFPTQMGHALTLNWSSVLLAQTHVHSSPGES